MGDYSPRRRTAVVFSGTGTAGAYHAGVLRALDESGAKIDLVVGSGGGALAAVFAAVAGGAQLYGSQGLWRELRWRDLYRIRRSLRLALFLLGMLVAAFFLPLCLALVAGVLAVPVLIIDLISAGFAARVVQLSGLSAATASQVYFLALAVPAFLVAGSVVAGTAGVLLTRRRRAVETLEFLLDAAPARDRIAKSLWAVAQGQALASSPASTAELSRRVVGLLSDSAGQPGFRELILRAIDLEAGRSVDFALLHDPGRSQFMAGRRRGSGGGTPVVDLSVQGQDVFLFDVVLTGVCLPFLSAIRRVVVPKGAPIHGGTHRLADASFGRGCGLADAIAAGAEQVILVTPVPADGTATAGRRGPRALLDALLLSLERSGLEAELAETERINLLVETMGHETDDGGRAWEDPTSGRVYRPIELYVVRPDRRTLSPLAYDGIRDHSVDVTETPSDMLERGYRDAIHQLVEPVIGGIGDGTIPYAPEPRGMSL